MASLTSDIQRALQLAVGEANNPFVQSQSHRTSKKKRTRNNSTEDADLGTRDKKKKKKSICSTDGTDNANQSPPSQHPKEPSKKDNGKATEVAHPLPGDIDQQETSVDSQHASSAAFLNAVVAAASATSDAQPMEIASYQASPPYQDQQGLPDQPSPYIQYPPVHYSFHDPSQFGQPPPQGHPNFPAPGGPVPDFHFASNDDIIRALQDMDMSKIASVLKSLGDAAAANSSANNPTFIPPLPATTTVRSQSQADLPSTSAGPVLSSVPKSTKSSHKRVLDMSLPGPEQTNSEHAHMLANKWMNANRLPETETERRNDVLSTARVRLDGMQILAAAERGGVDRPYGVRDSEDVFQADEGIQGVLVHAPSLHTLSLAGCTNLTDRSVEHICKLGVQLVCRLLTDLRFSDCAPEAFDLVRKVQHRYPTEWDAFELRCATVAAEIQSRDVSDEPLPSSESRKHPLDPCKRRHSLSSLHAPSSDNIKAPLSASESGHADRDASTRKPRLMFMDYMIKPVQRVCRYPLLFDQLQERNAQQRFSDGIHVSSQDPVKTALWTMRTVAGLVDEARRQHDLFAKSLQIVSRITQGLLTSVASHHRPPLSVSLSPFLASLAPCYLAGSLDVIHYRGTNMARLGTVKAKYLGAFLFPGGFLVLVKVAKSKAYEPKHWFNLRGFELVDSNLDDVLLPTWFRLSSKTHMFEFAASCRREKDIWVDAIRRAITEEVPWSDEPPSSLRADFAASLLEDVQFEMITPLPTIQSIPELDDVESALLNSGETTLVPTGGAQRFATPSSRGTSPPIPESNTFHLVRSTASAREQVDRGLLDVFSEKCLTARFHAHTHEEDLFEAQRVSRSFSRSTSALTMASAMSVAAKNRLTKRESVLVPRKKSFVEDVQDLVLSLGDPWLGQDDNNILPSATETTITQHAGELQRKRSVTDSSALSEVINELVNTERSDLRGFEHYKQYYVKREEAQSIFEREMMKKSSGFSAYIDRIKYSNADTRNRVGLRELLMDPVQRIPRYTLLFRTMIKFMGPDDAQRAKLIEADEIASKIAQAETDDHTRRAAVMYCLSATIDGFPAGLISNSRRFIDCIDVEDIVVDGPPGASSSASSISTTLLHCTLFLFDDKLMIVKRPGNGEKSGRLLSGLDEVEKLAKTGGLPLGMKKSGMSYKGVFDLCDVVVADVGDAEFHIYIENPPQDQGDRWSSRPFRSLSVVFPPAPINLDPTRTLTEKERFLGNLWSAQAKYRTKAGQSVVLCADEKEVEIKGGRTTVARTYFNVYQRTAFLQESKKTKVVMHIDPQGTADPLPFGMGGPPYVIVRVHPMAGEISRYSVSSSDPNDDPEEEIVQTSRISGRIVQTSAPPFTSLIAP
ncbi:hypothetical protein J3R82DRAFT_4309, partial [Butyriboletus roseoflavus]